MIDWQIRRKGRWVFASLILSQRGRPDVTLRSHRFKRGGNALRWVQEQLTEVKEYRAIRRKLREEKR